MNNQVANINDTVVAIQGQFEEIAGTHKQVVWREESEFALQAFNKNPYLMKCTPLTIQNAIKNIATVGLTLNPAHQLAYLVPEYNSQTKTQDCQLRISFQGLIRLATNSGAIKLVKAEIVCENDTFVYNGPLEMPSHQMGNPFKKSDRGNPIGVYCIALTHENKTICDLMDWDEVTKIKQAAKTQMVWDKWPLEMAKKAIIKRAYKQWPKTERSEQLTQAVSLLNEQEGNKDDKDLKMEFDEKLLDESDMEFYLYVQTLDESDYQNLFNSGENKKKMEFKKMVKDKVHLGHAEAQELVRDASSDDDETKEDAINKIKEMSEEYQQILRRLYK